MPKPEGLMPRVRHGLEQGSGSGSLPSRLLRAPLSPEPERWNTLAEGVTALWRNYQQLSSKDFAAIKPSVPIIAGAQDDIQFAQLVELARTIPYAQ